MDIGAMNVLSLIISGFFFGVGFALAQIVVNRITSGLTSGANK